MHIHFMQVGGTIDKDYLPNADNHGYNFSIEEPAFLRILGRGRATFSVSYGTIMRKDSLDMDDVDREKVADEVFASKHKMIVLTHGTDTIAKTAEVLGNRPNPEEKTIVLVGAMKLELYRDSDADFNLGVAVGAVQNSEAGVYMVIGGEVFKKN